MAVEDADRPIFQAGVEEGARQQRVKVLTFLQNKYLANDAPDLGTPEAQAIKSLARELSEHLK